MIDLHCHILPGLDDGARDLEDSVAMAQQASGDGIEVVCATPHLRADHHVRVEELERRSEALAHALAERGVGIRIVPAAELAQAQARTLTDAQLSGAAYGGEGRWILLEPAPGPLGAELERLVAHLGAGGLHTVIAHPERHAGADFRERLEALAQMGCLIQWTAEFLAQADEEDLVMELAGEGLVHLLGSDSHSSRAGRPVRLAAGFASLARALTPAQLEWSRKTAPQAIIGARAVPARP